MVEYLRELEPERGCGYRRVGKLYIRGIGQFVDCDRLSIPLAVCPVCGQGLKFARGWTKINPKKLFGKHGQYDFHCLNCGAELSKTDTEAGMLAFLCSECGMRFPAYEIEGCSDGDTCKVCNPPEKAYILWVGQKFYTPKSFTEEAMKYGISKVVPSIPKDFKVGEDIVYLAHKQAFMGLVEDKNTITGFREEWFPGIFMSFKPTHFEMLVHESEYNREKEKYDEMEERGIKIIVVPDNYEEMVEKTKSKKKSKR